MPMPPMRSVSRPHQERTADIEVFVKTTIAAGQKVSVTASHELLEMMIDPGAQLWAQNTDGKFYAYEMCDAVEDEE